MLWWHCWLDFQILFSPLLFSFGVALRKNKKREKIARHYHSPLIEELKEYYTGPQAQMKQNIFDAATSHTPLQSGKIHEDRHKILDMGLCQSTILTFVWCLGHLTFQALVHYTNYQFCGSYKTTFLPAINCRRTMESRSFFSTIEITEKK